MARRFTLIVIVDRASGFINVYQLRETKTKHIVEVLQKYNETYCGPPYWITSDGDPQFQAANQAIKTWCAEASIRHELSLAFSPESNGEAESAVKKVKLAISHAGDKLELISDAVANLN